MIGFLNDLSKYPPLPSHVFAMPKKIWKEKREMRRKGERKGRKKRNRGRVEGPEEEKERKEKRGQRKEYWGN